MTIGLGDIVRLKQSFIPPSHDRHIYRFAIVVGLVSMPTSQDKYQIIVHLYDPNSGSTYVDDLGTEAMYSFGSDEVEKV